MPRSRQESEKDQDRRRKKAYKWYKHYAKPTKASMCIIVDHYSNDTDITRQDVDLLPWNTEETKVIKKVIKALKKKDKKEKEEKKKEKEDKKKEQKDKTKEKERDVGEDTAFPNSNGYSKGPTLQMSNSSMTLNSSLNDSSGSLYAGSSSYKRRREPRREKRDAARKKSMSEVDMQEKRTADDTRASTIKGDHRLPVFLLPKRMITPTNTELKRQVERYRLASMRA
jgi:hypothetical protein